MCEVLEDENVYDDDDDFDLEFDEEEEEEDDDEQAPKRRAHDFRPIFELKLGSSSSPEEIEDWISSSMGSLSKNGSTVAFGQSYQHSGEGASVQELKCSYVHRLGCPFKLKIRRSAGKVAIFASGELNHVRNMNADRSRALEVKCFEVLQPFLDDPNRAVRAKKVWAMFEEALGVQR